MPEPKTAKLYETHFYIPVELHCHVKAASKEAGCTMNTFVIAALRRQLAIEKRVREESHA